MQMFHAMPQETQISALVSRETRELLERQARASGMKKQHLIEHALRHYLAALEHLPADVIVQPRLVVARRSFERRLRKARLAKPTRALRDLMRNGD